MTERTHLPLVNMDWANCRIKPHHRSTGGGRRTQRSVCPARLWTALRVQVSSSPLSARSWLVDGSSATPALAVGGFLSLFHVFSRSWAFASFLGPYFMGKIWIFRTTILCCHPGVCESCELLHESPGFICCEGSRVKIAGIPRRDHPLQSLDHPTAPHGWPRGNRPDRRQAWALYRHRRISVRWLRWHRAVIARRLPDLRSMTCGFFPLHFGR